MHLFNAIYPPGNRETKRQGEIAELTSKGIIPHVRLTTAFAFNLAFKPHFTGTRARKAS